MKAYKQGDVVLTATGEKATIYSREGKNIYWVWIAGWGLSALHITKIKGLVRLDAE